jgi:hypothetical protein
MRRGLLQMNSVPVKSKKAFVQQVRNVPEQPEINIYHV